MRILFTRFPLESADGGSENQTIWLMEGLRARGHEVSFLGSCDVLLRRTKELGMKNDELRIGIPPVTKWGAISFLWRRKKMQQTLIAEVQKLSTFPTCPVGRHFPPSTLIMLSLSEKLLLTPWAVSQGMRVIWIEHDRIGAWLRWNPWLPMLRRLSKLVTIVCVSELSRKMYEEIGFEKSNLIAIPNGIPSPLPSARPNVPIRYGRGEGSGVREEKQLRLGCLSRLSPEKGVDVLIQSLESLPEVSLSIVGKGRDEAYLRQLILDDTQRMGGERITLTSSVEDLDAFYRSLDVLVLPSSDHDPFGLVAAEAMMRGLPVIITDACGIAGYMEHDEDALIVPAGSPRALTDAIQHLLEPRARERLGARGQTKAEERFSLSRMIDAYEELLLGERKCV